MAALQLSGGHQASAKLLSFFHLRSTHRPLAFSERCNDMSSLFHNGFELFRIGGDRVIPSFHVLIESEMFLNHGRTKCDGSERNRGSQCVIAKAYLHTEGLLQSGHVA